MAKKKLETIKIEIPANRNLDGKTIFKILEREVAGFNGNITILSERNKRADLNVVIEGRTINSNGKKRDQVIGKIFRDFDPNFDLIANVDFKKSKKVQTESITKLTVGSNLGDRTVELFSTSVS